MNIYVKIFATLIRFVPGVRAGVPLEIDLPTGSTLADLVARLALPPDEVKVIFVNGKKQKQDYRLTAGDEVGIFPPIGGG